MSEPCRECKAINGRHHILCSLISLEEKVAYAEQYYKAWLRDNDYLHKRIDYFIKQVTMWQGKFAMVCQENNKLRRKLYHREKANP